MPILAPPNLNTPELAAAPDARFAPAPADGVFPEGFFSTTNLPTYVRIRGVWRTPQEPRMDAGLVIDSAGDLWAREMRRVKRGELVAVGQAEDGREGIFVHSRALTDATEESEFQFMTSDVSREKPIDYSLMAKLLVIERKRGGYIIWVAGPALVHSRARAELVWFINNGFVNAPLTANPAPAHDLLAPILS